MKRTVVAGLSVALLLAACSDDGSSSDETVMIGTTPVTLSVDESEETLATAPPSQEADPDTAAAIQELSLIHI